MIYQISHSHFSCNKKVNLMIYSSKSMIIFKPVYLYIIIRCCLISLQIAAILAYSIMMNITWVSEDWQRSRYLFISLWKRWPRTPKSINTSLFIAQLWNWSFLAEYFPIHTSHRQAQFRVTHFWTLQWKFTAFHCQKTPVLKSKESVLLKGMLCTVISRKL